MSDLTPMVTDLLLTRHDLDLTHLYHAFKSAITPNTDFADCFLQSIYYETWHLEDGIIKQGSFNHGSGVGIRSIQGESVGFGYSDSISFKSIQQIAKNAKLAMLAGQTPLLVSKSQKMQQPALLYSTENPISSIHVSDKLHLLREVDRIARAHDPRVKQVTGNLVGRYELVLILDKEGRLAADVRPLVRLDVSVIVEQAGRREHGFAGGGGRYDYEVLRNKNFVETFAKEAVRQGLVNLESIPAPAGAMPVVLASGWPGVLLHEAIGHGLEGDANRKGTSIFTGRIGEKVASSLCTIVDDATLPNRRGSLSIDDEGVTGQYTTLIEKGVLKNYLHDRHNAYLMHQESTGNGRRESYADVPIPRMTNTYMLVGESSPEEIIKSVDYGLYAVNLGGGQVDVTSGKFVFTTSEAYLIEKGKITVPVKEVTLIGNGLDILTKTSMVGNDLALDDGIGICGKDGQSVPVGVGQPTLKVDNMTVGGSAQQGE